MDSAHNSVEAVTLSEVLGLDSWNHPRTSQDLQTFIQRKHQELDLTVDSDEDDQLLG